MKIVVRKNKKSVKLSLRAETDAEGFDLKDVIVGLKSADEIVAALHGLGYKAVGEPRKTALTSTTTAVKVTP